MRRWTVPLAVVAILAVAFLLWNSDRRQLQRRLSKLEALLSKSAAEEQISAFGSSRQVAKLFAPGFLIRAVPYEGTLATEQDLVAAVYRFRTAAERIAVSLHQREMELRDNDTAQLLFVASVTMDFGGEKGRESYRVRSQWRKEQGEWLIGEIEVLEVLEEQGWWR